MLQQCKKKNKGLQGIVDRKGLHWINLQLWYNPEEDDEAGSRALVEELAEPRDFLLKNKSEK